jgi:plasmid replication initiation protein
MQENNLIVKEPEELVLMKGDFSESALKLSAYLIANLKKDKVIYKINIKDYLEKFDKKIGDYNYLYNVTQELSQKQFKMEDRFNKKFAIFNFIASANYADGVLEIEFSHRLLRYLLEIKDKYLRYNIINIMSLSSKYVIRLYKILKDVFEKNTRYGNKVELELSIRELREKLEIPKSYQYSSHIKKRILEKAKKELEEHTDIIFEYEEIKTGRKVTHLKFIIRPNPKKLKDNAQQFSYFKSRKAFVALLRRNYSGNGKFWGYKNFEGKLYWLGIDNNGLAYATNGKELKDFNAIESAELYDLWLTIAQNSDLYRELVLEGVCLKELAETNKELWLELKEDIIRLKDEGLI